MLDCKKSDRFTHLVSFAMKVADDDSSDDSSSNNSSSVGSAVPARSRELAVESPHPPESDTDAEPRQAAGSLATTTASYQCGQCNMSFAYLCDFHAHVRARKKPGTCRHCCKTFPGRGRLVEHVRSDHPDVEFRCELCGASFRSSTALRMHREVHATGRSHACRFCGENFQGRLLLIVHMRKTHIRYRCRQCGKAFVHRTSLQKHSEVHRPDKIHKCRHCDKAFANELNRTCHERRCHDDDRRPRCATCQRTFASGSSLKRHMETHLTKRDSYKCRYCARIFAGVLFLRDHERIRHTHRKICDKCGAVVTSASRHARTCRVMPHYRCPDCGKRFTDRVLLLIHERCRELGYTCKMLTNGSKCVCRTCKRICWREASLLAHLRRVHGVETEKPYECHICGKRFINADGHQQHVQLHGAERPFKCEHCDRAYIVKSRLQRHMLLAHSRAKPAEPNRCPICGETFEQQRSLTRHMQSVHPHQKPFKCSKCAKSFVSIEYVVRHERRHKAKSHKCQQCDKVYASKRQLAKHEKLHSGERFKCTRCRSTFSSIEALNEHLPKHKADFKTHTCPHCGKTYASSCAWLQHMKTHPELLLKCEKCDERFVTTRLLQRHKRKHGRPYTNTRSKTKSATTRAGCDV